VPKTITNFNSLMPFPYHKHIVLLQSRRWLPCLFIKCDMILVKLYVYVCRHTGKLIVRQHLNVLNPKDGVDQ